MNRAVCLEDDLVQTTNVSLSALAERFGQLIITQAGPLKVARHDAAIMDEEDRQSVDDVTKAARTVEDGADRPVGQQERGSARQPGGKLRVPRHHGGLDGAAQQQHHDDVDDAELGERSASEGPEPDDQKCDDAERMDHHTYEH